MFRLDEQSIENYYKSISNLLRARSSFALFLRTYDRLARWREFRFGRARLGNDDQARDGVCMLPFFCHDCTALLQPSDRLKETIPVLYCHE